MGYLLLLYGRIVVANLKSSNGSKDSSRIGMITLMLCLALCPYALIECEQSLLLSLTDRF